MTRLENRATLWQIKFTREKLHVIFSSVISIKALVPSAIHMLVVFVLRSLPSNKKHIACTVMGGRRIIVVPSASSAEASASVSTINRRTVRTGPVRMAIGVSILVWSFYGNT